MVPEQIERETVIAAPVERVWALLTEAEHLGRWFGDAGAELDLRPGGALSLNWERYGTVRGRVVDVDAPRRFSYRWSVLRESFDSEPVEGNSTLVEFTLEAEGDGTRLRVVESGFDTLLRRPGQAGRARRGQPQGLGAASWPSWPTTPRASPSEPR